MPLLSLPSLNPLPAIGFDTQQSTGGGVTTTADASQHSTWDAVITGIEAGLSVAGMAGALPTGVTAGSTSDTGSSYLERGVTIVLGLLLIAGGIIALTVNKETVISVAKTAIA